MRTLLLALAILACSNAQASAAPDELGRLLSHMQQRLALAEPVALSKWDSGKAVADPSREQQVIAAAERAAGDTQLERPWVAQFFNAQIEANKLLQYDFLHQWQRAGKAPGTPRQSLAAEIRPRLDTLQGELIASLAAFAPWRTAAQCPAWVARQLDIMGGTPTEHLALIRASAELCMTAR